MHLDNNHRMLELVRQIKAEQNEAIEKALGEGIAKGFISVRQSDPILIYSQDQDKVELRHSVVIDYLGAEKIEELINENNHLKKINSDLHNSLKEFYENTKVNTWLKNTQK